MMNIESINAAGYFDLKALVGNGYLHPGGLNSTIELFKNVNIKTHESILEVGCGNGYSTLSLLKAGYNIQPIDINQSMINATKRNLHENGYLFVSPKLCSAEHLLFSECSFSMVLIEAVFGFIRNTRAAIKEFNRVLTPGGCIGYVDMHYVSPPSQGIIDELSSIFGYEINTYYKNDWLNIHNDLGFDLVYWNEYKMNNAKMPTLDRLIEFLSLRYPELDRHTISECSELILKKSLYYEAVFIKNRQYLKYHVAVFKKRPTP